MPLSFLCLAIYMFFDSASRFGWFTVDNKIWGVVALLTAILLLVEGLPLVQKKYFVK